MLRFSLAGIVCLAALAPPAAAPAQSAAPTAVVSGTVTDSAGGPVPGVWILAVGPDQSIAARVLSDSTGGFRLPPLPPAGYVLIATGPGFRMIDDASVTLGADPVSGVRIRMRRTSIPQPVPDLPPPAMDNDSGGGNRPAYDQDRSSQRPGAGRAGRDGGGGVGRDGLGRATPRVGGHGGDAGRAPAGGAGDARHPGVTRPGGGGGGRGD